MMESTLKTKEGMQGSQQSLDPILQRKSERFRPLRLTTNQNIVDYLDEVDIKITVGEIVQMSKTKETSNIPTENLEKTLDPSVWPLRVCVRKNIHCWKRYSDRNGTTSVSDSERNGTTTVKMNSTTGGVTSVQ